MTSKKLLELRSQIIFILLLFFSSSALAHGNHAHESHSLFVGLVLGLNGLILFALLMMHMIKSRPFQ